MIIVGGSAYISRVWERTVVVVVKTALVSYSRLVEVVVMAASWGSMFHWCEMGGAREVLEPLFS